MDTVSNQTLLRLAELAIANGWHPIEVANTVQTVVRPMAKTAVPHTVIVESSPAVQSLFRRAGRNGR